MRPIEKCIGGREELLLNDKAMALIGPQPKKSTKIFTAPFIRNSAALS